MRTVINPQGNSISLSGGLSGGSLNLAGNGLLALSGSSSYNGGTTIGSGTLSVASDASLGAVPLPATASNVVIASGATLQLPTGFMISSNRGIGLGDTAATINVGSGTANYAGVLAAAPGASLGSLTKTGNGALVLGGSNTYAGATNVNGGGLYVNGSLPSTSPVIIGAAGALGGSGSAGAATVNSGGTIDVSANGTNSLSLASLTFNGNAAINLPALTSTSSVALQTGSLIVNGNPDSVQLYFPQTSINNGLYRLLTYSGSIGGAGAGYGAFLVVSPPPLGSRKNGSLQNNGQEIDYLVVGQTPYWNGQQPDWQSTNGWTLQPSGSQTSFESQDSDVFDNTVATGPFATTVTINQGNVNPISATFNNTTSAYSISGSNGMVGTAFVQINGAGGLTISNSNGYSSGTQFNAGTLNINNFFGHRQRIADDRRRHGGRDDGRDVGQHQRRADHAHHQQRPGLERRFYLRRAVQFEPRHGPHDTQRQPLRKRCRRRSDGRRPNRRSGGLAHRYRDGRVGPRRRELLQQRHLSARRHGDCRRQQFAAGRRPAHDEPRGRRGHPQSYRHCADHRRAVRRRRGHVDDRLGAIRRLPPPRL